MPTFRYVTAFSLLWLISIIGQAQSSSPSVDSPAVPSHSGHAAGTNGPTVTAPPPPRSTTNSVNNGANNAAKRSFTGIVSDSFCARHHYMLTGANDTECTRYCIAHQGNYVLMVGGKVYALQNRPGHVLDSLAGKQARVSGALLSNDVLQVDSVSPVER